MSASRGRVERVRIATRGSVLALRQTESVAERLRAAWPDLVVELVTASTPGDRDKHTPLTALGQGVFVKGVEEALLAGRADLAVHSLKDVPTDLTPGLELLAYPVREDPRDGLVARRAATETGTCRGLADLSPSARVGTGSPRRTAQLLALRPDLRILPVRGNLDTRIAKLRAGEFDALVLAVAGLARLGRLDELDYVFDADECTPPAGQGALVVQGRADDEDVRALLDMIDDPSCRTEVLAERAFLVGLGGGCQLPAGALARVESGALQIVGVAASVDGQELVREHHVGPSSDPIRVGRELGDRLLPRARSLLAPSVVGA